MEDIKKLIQENDTELSAREDELIERVNTAYDGAIKEAIKEFKYLTLLNSNINPTHEQVKKIVEKTIEAFREEFEQLIDPFQKELFSQYQEGLKEAANILALKDSQ